MACIPSNNSLVYSARIVCCTLKSAKLSNKKKKVILYFIVEYVDCNISIRKFFDLGFMFSNPLGYHFPPPHPLKVSIPRLQKLKFMSDKKALLLRLQVIT